MKKGCDYWKQRGGCAVARLIDAEATKLAICRDECGADAEECSRMCCRFADIIDEMPTVDPVLHAKWLYDRPGHWFCSNCHLTEGWASQWQKYCPMCGAKMDKDGDADD